MEGQYGGDAVTRRLRHDRIDLAAEIAATGEPAGFAGCTGTGEPVADQATFGAARADQDFDEAGRLLRRMDGPTVGVAGVDHRSHQARAAVLADIVTGLDVAGVRGAFLAPHGTRCGVRRGLNVVVDGVPWHVGAVELRGQFMHPFETISMKAGAVLLFPDDFLRVAETGCAKCFGGSHEAAQQTEHPYRT